MSQHWTERSTEDFVYRIASDFAAQIEQKMLEERLNQSALAEKLGVSDASVSQVLRNPSNFTLKKIAKYARSLGMKVAIVAYEDNDPQNQNGPVNSQVFNACWQRQGKPTDFFSLRGSPKLVHAFLIDYISKPRRIDQSQNLDEQLLGDLVWQKPKSTEKILVEAP
jgi:transcriptional regulator with XRE-family HTH domain